MLYVLLNVHVPSQLYLSISVILTLASFSAFRVQSFCSQYHVSFPFHVSCY
nr:MAG TPA: hypothetical protein [Caudoviricetes sp.]